ncbi:hypothetical protein V6N11_031307 [Hibiscus sabdariffa]|uniref:Pentatricopeptide repeat-containing protein n=1 Tax=Hibiscus sabdariffa TaxID=183260 RepID=A0ABR2SXB2_9ROSI
MPSTHLSSHLSPQGPTPTIFNAATKSPSSRAISTQCFTHNHHSTVTSNQFIKMSKAKSGGKGVPSFELDFIDIDIHVACEENENISKSREVFAQMPERTTSSYNAIIKTYNKNGGMVDEAYELFCYMPERDAHRHSNVLINRYFQRYGKHWEIGYDSRFGCIDAANLVFDMRTRKDLVSWNYLIMVYLQENETEKAYELVSM